MVTSKKEIQEKLIQAHDKVKEIIDGPFLKENTTADQVNVIGTLDFILYEAKKQFSE